MKWTCVQIREITLKSVLKELCPFLDLGFLVKSCSSRTLVLACGALVCASSTSLLKTLWEKEKLLIMSNFSFSHSVFNPVREFPPFSPNLKWSSANSSSLGRVKKFVVWEC